MNWKFWKQPKPTEQVRLKTVVANSLTVSKWREVPMLVTESQKLLSNPHMIGMLDVLRNDAPHNYGMITKGAQPMEYAERVGMIQGYLMCLNNLEALALPLEKHEMPEATFEPIEKE